MAEFVDSPFLLVASLAQAGFDDEEDLSADPSMRRSKRFAKLVR